MEASDRQKKLGRLTRAFVASALIWTAAGQAGTLDIKLEGCKSSLITSGWLLEDNNITCNADAYIRGNLDDWAELDLVPFKLIVQNTSDDPSDQKIAVMVGGDFERTTDSYYGWDYVSPLWLDGESDPACGGIVVHNYTFVGDEVGGSDSSIHRIVTFDNIPQFPNGSKKECVFNFFERLALGSSDYSGSSLSAFVKEVPAGYDAVDLTGYKIIQIGQMTIPLPDALATTVSKSMAAAQDSTYGWSIEKSGTGTVDFGDTCAPGAVKERDVDVTVAWTRLDPAPVGMISAVSKITVDNKARRSLGIDVNDTLYNDGAEIPGSLTSVCAESSPIIAGGTYDVVCTLLHDDLNATLYGGTLSDTAVVTFVDPQQANFPDMPPISKHEEVSAIAQMGTGDELNAEANVTDHEWMDSPSGLIMFASGAVEPADMGSYDAPYTEGEWTTGDVNWTSIVQSGSGSVTFHKSVSISPDSGYGIVVSDTLKDTARVAAADTGAAAGHSIAIGAAATVALTITKTVEDAIIGPDESVAFDFNVTGPEGYQTIVTIPLNGVDYNETTLTGLTPGIYTVKELEQPPFMAADGVQKQKDLGVVDGVVPCSGTVSFTNRVQKAKVLVQKTTQPSGDGNDLDAGWVMTLYRGDAVLDTNTTDENGMATFDVELGEGHYTIVEGGRDGWYADSSSGCDFAVNLPDDANKTFTCSFENVKYATVIINKTTNPDWDTTSFSFTQDVNGTDGFMLAGGEQATFMYVKPGSYEVNESDPGADYFLSDLQCTETGAPNLNVTTWNKAARSTSLLVDAGETVECRFTNTAYGTIDVTKYFNGSSDLGIHSFHFDLREGHGVDPLGALLESGDADAVNNIVDFGGIKLVPGDYSVCETGVPVAWSIAWSVDGLAADANHTNIDPQASNEEQCIDVVVGAGTHVAVEVDNKVFQGEGEQRTIGYWKNWNTCSGGNQQYTAAKNGGAAEGYFLLDDVLPIVIGIDADGVEAPTLVIGSCETGVLLLDKRQLNGKNRKAASDAAYAMVAQLIAAKANLKAGADECGILPTITAADELLNTIGFNGEGSYLSPKDTKKPADKALAEEAHMLAGTLDEYNNGLLCQ